MRVGAKVLKEEGGPLNWRRYTRGRAANIKQKPKSLDHGWSKIISWGMAGTLYL
jgi:hypothetical protein